LEGDLAALDGLFLHRRSIREVNGNWKLVIDAFLDGYHIRHLHRDTIYRFFTDARFEAERAGPRIRAVTARRALFEPGDLDLRLRVTPRFLGFPRTSVILHPDYASILCLTPLAPNRTRFVHAMLVPDRDRIDHWDKSFALIDEGVFAREDLAIVEAMQRGI